MLTIPFLDDSIIATLDYVISFFQIKDHGHYAYPPEEVLQRTLEDLKTIKAALAKFSNEMLPIKLSSKSDKDDSSDQLIFSDYKTETQETKSPNEIVRRSLEMLNNNRKFTKLVDKKSSPKKHIDSKGDSSKRISKEIINNVPAHPTWSLTSIRNSMTVSPCSMSDRKSSTSKRITRKISRQVLVKKADKKMKNTRKYSEVSQHEPMNVEENNTSANDEPDIISTYYATCRIHSYEDNSHTFEIIQPSRVNCFGDDNGKSDIVIVVLANGQTALFTSKSSSSFMNTFYHEANRIRNE